MSDPTWLPDVLRAAGLKCDIYPGAMDRGHGDFGGIWGVVAHHTGSNGATPGSIANHPELGLCSQLHLGRDGKYTVTGVGIAWHAGMGSWPGISTNNANQVTIGIEAANDGTSWPAAQYAAYVRGVAAILNKLGHPSSRVIGHKEWAGAAQGKWDPGNIDMARFRADVARVQTELRKGGAVSPVVINRIDELVKTATWLGKRLHDGEKKCADGVGRYAEFEHGVVYWSPTTGAHAIPNGPLRDAFTTRGWEQKRLGYPVRAANTKLHGGGQCMAFQGGILYTGFPNAPTAGVLVHGVIGDRWAKEGYEDGTLGYPLADEETTVDGGQRQRFEHGNLLWHPSGAPNADAAVRIEANK